MLWLLACTGATPDDTATPVVTLGETTEVVPAQMPAETELQDANNNLHVEEHDGRLWLAFRTAPNHFASADAQLHVVSTEDETTWRHEGTFHLETDLREPHLVSWQGQLRLYFAVLGDNPMDFEPQGTRVTTWEGSGSWTEPEEIFERDFIVWRIRELHERLYLTGYTGGGNIYDFDGEPLEVHWLASDDGESWEPVVPDKHIFQTGGGSETDFAFLEDGSVVAVTRNEAGDETGWGSKICTAPADDLGNWTCEQDPNKYDSPLVFRRSGHTWLVARRNVTETGNYDLGLDDLDHGDQTLRYQAEYWAAPKRCALWEVHESDRTVEWVLDLPSAGDTCFPSRSTFGGPDVIYNYSSDPEVPEISWLDGQTGLTAILRTELVFE